ncbi:hypothetical protein [Nocardia stercoris]|uniref:DUF559 domain-containing protein n=1 Tax=Nocardia stercoris TaxID=2483361 RepID=A0A3M2LEN3_9NOCA|nr:hypothetical protein [Nocardia stercoris]RMI35526.1 hypothetical protein EBN03_04590 [Nocardia stercoris]
MQQCQGIPRSADEEIRRVCSGGYRQRLRRATRTHPAARTAAATHDRHRSTVLATLRNLAPGSIVSHQSAALLYRVPVELSLLDRVHVTRNRNHGGRITPTLAVHVAAVDTVAELAGLAVTTPARTVVDLARTVPFEAAVVAGDALAREYGVTATDLTAELHRAARRVGIGTARQVVAFLDPRSPGIGHSRSRVMLRRLGIPQPRSQGDVQSHDRRRLGRVDFWFGDTGVVGVFDGHLRYGRAVHPGGDVVEALAREQSREEALRRHGFQVVRWTWDELADGTAAARIRAALARAGRHRPQGHIRPAELPAPRPLTLRPL